MLEEDTLDNSLSDLDELLEEEVEIDDDNDSHYSEDDEDEGDYDSFDDPETF